jgi:hypothetical protein
MSLGQIVIEGAARAAQMVPLLFALNSPPVVAQLPRAAAGDTQFGTAVEEAAPLLLTEHHVDVRISGGKAQVRTTLTYRNDRGEPVSTSFAFPFPTLLEQGGAWRALGDEIIEAGDCADESAEDAEFAEVGEAIPPRIDVGYVTVAPGEEIKLETHREVDLVQRAGGYRLALPLPIDRSAPYSPQFSADVTVQGLAAVKRLVSITHGGTVVGLGTPRAQLTVPNGRAYAGTQFVVDVEHGATAPMPHLASWGGEARPR